MLRALIALLTHCAHSKRLICHISRLLTGSCYFAYSITECTTRLHIYISTYIYRNTRVFQVSYINYCSKQSLRIGFIVGKILYQNFFELAFLKLHTRIDGHWYFLNFMINATKIISTCRHSWI